MSSAHDCYNELCGKEFNGSFRGTRTLNLSSKQWKLIDVDSDAMNDSLITKLQKIEKDFEGRIWKGITSKSGKYTLWVESGDLKNSSNFRIKKYDTFRITAQKEKYRDGLGFHFIVETS